MDYEARYVTLRAKPNTWFDTGTEVFHYDYEPEQQIRITVEEYEEWKKAGGILCRGLRNGKWDGEYCHIDEFVVNSMICPDCELSIEDCTCHDIEP